MKIKKPDDENMNETSPGIWTDGGNKTYNATANIIERRKLNELHSFLISTCNFRSKPLCA